MYYSMYMYCKFHYDQLASSLPHYMYVLICIHSLPNTHVYMYMYMYDMYMYKALLFTSIHDYILYVYAGMYMYMYTSVCRCKLIVKLTIILLVK